MDTVWHVRQCEGIICTLMNTYNRWNVDWWPDDRFADSMPERMLKIIYSSPYASHETATSSHIVKYWYRIKCPSIWKHNGYINVHLQRWNVAGRSIKMALFCLFCLLNIRHAVLSIDYAYDTPTYKLSPAPSIVNCGWFKQAFSKQMMMQTNPPR